MGAPRARPSPWLEHDKTQRRHSALGGEPPVRLRWRLTLPLGCLERLEAKGMVERHPDTDERGKVWVHALPFDDAQAGANHDEIIRKLERIHTGFSVANLRPVLRYLNEVRDVR